MTGREIVERIREKNVLGADAAVGVRGCSVKNATVEGDGRTLEFVATTDDIDGDTEVVVPSGLDPSRFVMNGNIFVNHQYRVEDIVGKLRSVTPFSKLGGQSGWKIRAYMVPGVELADAVLAIAAAGGIGVSIGFLAKDYGKPTIEERKAYTRGGVTPLSIIRKADWFETSIVGIPCNPFAGMVGSKAVSDTLSLLDDLVVKGKITRKAAEAFGLKAKIVTRIQRAPTVVRSM